MEQSGLKKTFHLIKTFSFKGKEIAKQRSKKKIGRRRKYKKLSPGRLLRTLHQQKVNINECEIKFGFGRRAAPLKKAEKGFVRSQPRQRERVKKFSCFSQFGFMDETTTGRTRSASRNVSLNGSLKVSRAASTESRIVCQWWAFIKFHSKAISLLTGFAWLINFPFIVSL